MKYNYNFLVNFIKYLLHFLWNVIKTGKKEYLRKKLEIKKYQKNNCILQYKCGKNGIVPFYVLPGSFT